MERRKVGFKDLSFKEKLEFIWDYYKLHIGLTILGVIVVGWILNHYIINPPADVVLDISCFNVSMYLGSDDIDQLQDDLTDLVTDDPKHETANIDFYETESEDTSVQMATITQISGKATLGEFDVMIFRDDSYEDYTQDEVLEPLDEVVSLDGVSEDDYLTGEDIGLEGDNRVYLVDVTGLEKLSAIETEEGNYYLGIFSETKHPDQIQAFWSYIYGE